MRSHNKTPGGQPASVLSNVTLVHRKSQTSHMTPHYVLFTADRVMLNKAQSIRNLRYFVLTRTKNFK